MKANLLTNMFQKTDNSSISRAYDAKDFKNAREYCDMYLELFCVDKSHIENIPKFYIREFKQALETLPKDKQLVLKKYFGLEGGIKHYLKPARANDKAMQKMLMDAIEALDYLQSFSRVYIYHAKMRDTIDKIAKKVFDPKNEYTNIEKAKYAHMYYRYIKDFQFMPYDYKREEKILTAEQKVQESKVFAVADVLTDEYEYFFKNMPDGEIIIPLLQSILHETYEECEDIIKRDCQLSEDKYDRIFLGDVRAAKEKMFESGEWINGDLCTVSSIKKMTAAKMLNLCLAFQEYQKEYKWEAQKESKRKVIIPTQGEKIIKVPKFYKNAIFADASEQLQFLYVIEFLHNREPEFEFHKKPFISYGFYELVS